jgi:hypothetical protein
MLRLTALALPTMALLGAAALATPGHAQDFWRCANPECSLIEPGYPRQTYRPAARPPSPWEPRHEPWLTPRGHQAPPPPGEVFTRREWLPQHDPRAWGEPRQPWHADDDRRHGRWRGNGLFD